MTLEIKKPAYKFLLELMEERRQLLQEYEVLRTKKIALLFGVEDLIKLPEEQLNELKTISDEMKKLYKEVDIINTVIVVEIEDALKNNPNLSL